MRKLLVSIDGHNTARMQTAVAKTLFAAAGVPCAIRTAIGRSAASIAQQAQALGCDGIVIGRDAGESLVNRMFGNLVQRVQHIVGGTGNCQVLGP